jgi:phage terminase small subunit
MPTDDDSPIQEYAIGEAPPEPQPPLWHSHDWTGQEVTFAAEFLRTGNMARAYRAAYNDKTQHASFRGAQLMHKPWMRDYVEECRALMRQRLKVTEDTIIEEIAKLAFANMTDFIVINEAGEAMTDLSGLTREQLAALSEVTIDTYMDGKGEDARPVKSVKFKLAPKLAALELLGKKHKLWTDVVENTSVVDIADELRAARRERQARREERADTVAQIMGKPEGDDDAGQDGSTTQGDDDSSD